MNLFTLTFVALLVLKLIGTITVSWWIVFSPLILAVVIPMVFGFIVVALGSTR